MNDAFRLTRVEKLIVQDKRLSFTLVSYVLVLVIYANLNVVQSPILGVAASSVFFLIDVVFLGYAFFEREEAFFRVMLGIIALVLVLGFFGWLAVIIYDLDIFRFTLVLFATATFSSFSSKMGRIRKWFQK